MHLLGKPESKQDPGNRLWLFCNGNVKELKDWIWAIGTQLESMRGLLKVSLHFPCTLSASRVRGNIKWWRCPRAKYWRDNNVNSWQSTPRARSERWCRVLSVTVSSGYLYWNRKFLLVGKSEIGLKKQLQVDTVENKCKNEFISGITQSLKHPRTG